MVMTSIDTMQGMLQQAAGSPDDARIGLAGVFYTSREYFEHERSTVLQEGWHCLGRADEIPKPGNYFTAQILDEPLLVVRGDDNEIRVLSNVCRHRSMPVAEGAGTRKVFVCSYHGWSYRRDGTLLRAANMENNSFDPTKCRLPEFHCELWGGFIYANIADNPTPLQPVLAKLHEQIAPYETEKFRTVHVAEEEWQCNWKCLVENFMEGYHLSVVHPKTLRDYTPTELCSKGISGPDFTSYHANYPDDIAPRGAGADGLNEKQRKQSFLFSVFPTQVVSQAASLLVSLNITPLEVNSIRVRWTMSVYGDEFDEDTIAQRVALWNEVNREDREKLEKMQVTLASKHANPPPLAADHFEGTIRDFHVYLAART